jgi:hypothetical protein
MIERGERFDARGDQFIREALVEIHALRVRLAGTLGEDARPGDREPIW